MTNYIPHAVIKSVKHYPNNILITILPGLQIGKVWTVDAAAEYFLFVTKEFTTDANGITGKFEQMPQENPISLNGFDPNV